MKEIDNEEIEYYNYLLFIKILITVFVRIIFMSYSLFINIFKNCFHDIILIIIIFVTMTIVLISCYHQR